MLVLGGDHFSNSVSLLGLSHLNLILNRSQSLQDPCVEHLKLNIFLYLRLSYLELELILWYFNKPCSSFFLFNFEILLRLLGKLRFASFSETGTAIVSCLLLPSAPVSCLHRLAMLLLHLLLELFSEFSLVVYISVLELVVIILPIVEIASFKGIIVSMFAVLLQIDIVLILIFAFLAHVEYYYYNYT